MQLDKGPVKEATCLLSVWYMDDGSIQAVQLTSRSFGDCRGRELRERGAPARCLSRSTHQPGSLPVSVIEWLMFDDDSQVQAALHPD
jgi:hypothetical protein